MSTVRTIQHRMTQGELDPKMLGRSDIEQYYGAAEEAENVIIIPQGGFKRRGGLEHIQKNLRQITITAPTVSAPNGGTTGNLTDQNTATSFTTSTGISTTDPYVVAQYDLGSSQSMAVVYIYGVALSSGTSSEFFVQGSADAASWTNVGSAISLTTTAKNHSRRVDNSYRYLRLARIGSTNLGAATVTLTGMDLFTSGALSETRHFKFEFSSDQSYHMLATDKNIAVYKNGIFQIDLYLADLTSARLADISYAASADTLIIFHEDVQTYRVQRAGADDAWTVTRLPFESIPYYAFTEVSTTGAALGWGTLKPNATTGTTYIDISAGSLTSAHVGQYVEGNGGRARILNVQSSTKADIFIEIPFYNTDSIAAANWELLTGYEPTWSVSRGWPICGTFHEGRLWIGGSKSRPSTIWGSRIGIYYDFDIGTALDDEAIEASLDTDQLNRITNMYSGRSLMVFTTGAEFVIPQSLNEPITPSNISTSRQSSVGSTRGLGVFEVEGGVFYCQNGGQSVQEFIFNDTQQAYGNNIVSLLSGHLVKSPVDFALRRATSLDDGALLVQVLANGEAAIATIQRSQNISAFTRQTTDGTFKSCGVDYNDIYFVVERVINGSTERYLERLNEAHLLDASARFTTGLPTTTFTNLYQIEGKECRVVADGSVLDNVTPSSGSATISRNAEDYCEIGLWFAPIFTDLPVELPGQQTLLGKKLNISEIVIRFYETISCKINNKTVQFRQFGGDLLDQAPTPFTGVKRMYGWRGWSDGGQITITQDAPTPLTVLAISKRITFEG